MGRVNVHTWSDAFGNWHARVTGAKDAHNAKLHASRAIREEVAARQGVPLGNLKLELDTLTHMPGYITFREA